MQLFRYYLRFTYATAAISRHAFDAVIWCHATLFCAPCFILRLPAVMLYMLLVYFRHWWLRWYCHYSLIRHYHWYYYDTMMFHGAFAATLRWWLCLCHTSLRWLFTPYYYCLPLCLPILLLRYALRVRAAAIIICRTRAARARRARFEVFSRAMALWARYDD